MNDNFNVGSMQIIENGNGADPDKTYKARQIIMPFLESINNICTKNYERGNKKSYIKVFIRDYFCILIIEYGRYCIEETIDIETFEKLNEKQQKFICQKILNKMTDIFLKEAKK
jgi:hypothetical protein